MPKRTSGKQKPDGEAERKRSEGFARAPEPDAILRRKEDATTMEPVAAGSNPVPTATGISLSFLKTNTREKLLYKVACAGSPLGNEFFDQFPDMKEVLELAFNISIRLLVVAICNGEVSPAQRISAMRLVATLNGKSVPSEDDSAPFKPNAPLAIPTGSKEDVTRTLEAIKRVSAG